MNPDRHTATRKPERCPACDSPLIADICYGYPSRETAEAAGRGEIVLGGCLIDDANPQWKCRACQTLIYPQ